MSQSGLVHNPEAALTPAEIVIEVLGLAEVSILVNKTPWAIQKWKRPLRTGGMGGLVPSRHQAKLLQAIRCACPDFPAEKLIAEPLA